MNNIFHVSEQIQPPGSAKPFFIVETVFTSDGPRSRVCDGRWATLEEVSKELANKLAARAGR